MASLEQNGINERLQTEACVSQREQLLHAVFQSLSSHVVVLDHAGTITYASHSWEEFAGANNAQMDCVSVGANYLEVCRRAAAAGNDPHAQESFDGLSRVIAGELPTFSIEYPCDSLTHRRWFLMQVDPMPQEHGGVIISHTDITTCRHSEDALRISEEKFRTLIRDLHVGVLIQGPQAEILLSNRAALDMLGLSEDHLIGKTSFDTTWDVLSEDGSTLRNECHPVPCAIATRKPVRNIIMGVYRPATQDRVWLLVDAIPHLAPDGVVVQVICTFSDITERKRGAEARAHLLQRLAIAQEEERHRIARELHDQVGQYLAVFMIGLKSLQNSADAASPAQESIARLQKLTAQFSQEVRRIALDLRPTTLDDLGLHAALVNYLDEWSERFGIRVDFHSNGLINRRLPPHVETALYRVIQEGLNNVLKHAQAQRVSVILEHSGDYVKAILEDDGVGFDVGVTSSAPVTERRLGLMGMRERIELVGGRLEIESAPGSGTTLVVQILTPT